MRSIAVSACVTNVRSGFVLDLEVAPEVAQGDRVGLVAAIARRQVDPTRAAPRSCS